MLAPIKQHSLPAWTGRSRHQHRRGPWQHQQQQSSSFRAPRRPCWAWSWSSRHWNCPRMSLSPAQLRSHRTNPSLHHRNVQSEITELGSTIPSLPLVTTLVYALDRLHCCIVSNCRQHLNVHLPRTAGLDGSPINYLGLPLHPILDRVPHQTV